MTIVTTEEGCLIVPPDEGAEVRSIANAPTVLKAGAAETEGLAVVYEQATPARSGPPPHIHHESAEMFIVLEGDFVFRINGREVRAPRGTFAYVPKGVAHSYFNSGPEPGRIVYWFTPPAKMEEYFHELSQLPPGPVDRTMLDAIAARHGVEILERPADRS